MDFNDQIELVTGASMSDFEHYVQDYTLKSKAVQELFKPRIYQGLEKFEVYVILHGQFKLEDERKLLETRRRDLQGIYFKYCSCHKANERFIVKNLDIAEMYYRGHCPCAVAQQDLLKSARKKNIYLFIKAYPFDNSVREKFMQQADKRLRTYYLMKHPA